MKKASLIVVILLAFIVRDASSQSSEIGITLGMSSYKGDITESMFDSRFFHPAAGIMFRRSFTNHWAGKLAFNIGTISGDDAKSDQDFKVNRDLHFKSSLWELSGVIEFNFFPFQVANLYTYGTPFLFVGLGVFHFNPKAEYAGDWYELQPLSTEGQGLSGYPGRDEYKLTQMSIPFGAGVKFRMMKRVGVTIDGGARRTFTDYIDDVSTTYVSKFDLLTERDVVAAILSDPSTALFDESNVNRQRGNASDNDWYFFAGVSFSWTLSKKYNDSCKPFRQKFK